MIYAIAIFALWAGAYLFCRWLASAAPETINTPKAIDAFYHAPGRVGSTKWDRI